MPTRWRRASRSSMGPLASKQARASERNRAATRRPRDQSTGRVVGHVEDGIEARGLDVDTFFLEVAVKALLPGDAVGVQRAPEVEEHGGVHSGVLLPTRNGGLRLTTTQ